MQPDLLAFCFHGQPNHNPARTRHAHDHHEFLYVLEGRGFQLSNSGEVPCAAGDLFFFPPGLAHNSHCRPAQSLRAAVVSLRESLFSPRQEADRRCLSVLGQLRRPAERRGLLPLSAEGSDRVGRSLRALVGEFEQRRPGHECAAKALMMEVLTVILRDPEYRPDPAASLPPLSHQALVEEVLWYLRANCASPISVEDVLRFVPMSRSHFHAVFRAVTGRTMIAVLRELRVRRARELLAGSDRSVLEVSMECGFGSLSHFCHSFKALAGCPPGEYRRRHG
jgi:AraC-like DNA-binding protein